MVEVILGFSENCYGFRCKCCHHSKTELFTERIINLILAKLFGGISCFRFSFCFSTNPGKPFPGTKVNDIVDVDIVGFLDIPDWATISIASTKRITF